MGATAGYRNPHNVSFSAGQTSLSGTVVDPVMQLEPATFAIDANVLRVRQSAAASLNRFAEHTHDRSVQLGDFAGFDGVGRSIPAHSGEVQALVAVDVADASDDMLIEQQRLDLTRTATKDVGELLPTESVGEWVDAHLGDFWQFHCDVARIEHDNLTERARIDEP